MERHIYSIVYEHLAEQELLSDAQLGFSPGKSTVTALVSLSYGKMVLISNLTYIKLSIVSIPKDKILDCINTFCSGLPHICAIDS